MSETHSTILHSLLRQAGIVPEEATQTPLSGDGSDRPFYRIRCGAASFLAALPSPTLERGRAEAHAAAMIGTHLARAGVPVPAILAYDRESGAILFEDLGARLLFHAFHAGSGGIDDLYGQAVTRLADFQRAALDGFQPDWCWDTVRYDQALMISRESQYFAREFCGKFIGVQDLPAGLAEEFSALAERIAHCPVTGLMHRDYQSRNLMITEGEIRIIDYQGARFGPLAYDLASLLNDPYVSLGEESRRALLETYLLRLGSYISLDPARFIEDYQHIALQRNLQVLGAYAFLTRERGKPFFSNYIDPALRRLVALLAGTLAGEYPILQGLACRIAAARQDGTTYDGQ